MGLHCNEREYPEANSSTETPCCGRWTTELGTISSTIFYRTREKVTWRYTRHRFMISVRSAHGLEYLVPVSP